MSQTPETASARMPAAQAPSFYRFAIGDHRATIVSDGVLPMGRPEDIYGGRPAEAMKSQLSESFLSTDEVVLEQNILVLDTGEKLVLFDTGMGSLDVLGPTPGKLFKNLALAGVDPGDVDAVVLSHAHIDHVGGCVADDGKPNFPNAEYFISRADYDFWTAETGIPEGAEVFFETARKNLVPIRERTTFYGDEQEILPGVHTLLAPGHTVGHTMFMINSGDKSLCYIADMANHPVLLLANPLIEFVHDTDAKLAARTRVRMLDMLAENRTQILSYHFPWPGIGHVAKRGDGFVYHPEPMKMQQT